MRELNAAINALHSYCVLIVLVKATENVQQLCLRHFRNKFDHFI